MCFLLCLSIFPFCTYHCQNVNVFIISHLMYLKEEYHIKKITDILFIPVVIIKARNKWKYHFLPIYYIYQ